MFYIIEHFLKDIDKISENYQKAQEAKKEMKEMKKLQFEQDLSKFNEQSKNIRKRGFKRRGSTGSLEDLKRRYLPAEEELYDNNESKPKGGKRRKKKKRTKKKNNKKKKKKTKRRRN